MSNSFYSLYSFWLHFIRHIFHKCFNINGNFVIPNSSLVMQVQMLISFFKCFCNSTIPLNNCVFSKYFLLDDLHKWNDYWLLKYILRKSMARRNFRRFVISKFWISIEIFSYIFPSQSVRLIKEVFKILKNGSITCTLESYIWNIVLRNLRLLKLFNQKYSKTSQV